LSKANYDRLLDVARETYKENVDDILQLTQKVATEHDLPYVPVFNTSGAGLGFWLTVRKDEVPELRKGCIEVTGKGSKWRFTTLELVSSKEQARPQMDRAPLAEKKECSASRLSQRCIVDEWQVNTLIRQLSETLKITI
jgi:DNA mismatch repair protein MSH4